MRVLTNSLRGFTLFVLTTAAGRAQSVTLEVQPNSIALSPSYNQVEARAILKNGLATAIQEPSLTFLTNDGVPIEIGRPSSRSAQPGHSIVWPLMIKNPGQGRVPGAILLEAKYREAGKPCERVYATLSITSQADNPKPVEVSVEGTFDAISEQRPAPGYLVLTNNFDIPLALTITAHLPPNTELKEALKPLTLAPRSTAQIPFEIRARSRVTPGAYPALFEISADWSWGGRAEHRAIMISKPATLGIFFESDLLKALGIPSFLVLPGCLVIFTMQLLVKLGFGGVKNESKLPDLGVTTPGFWILSITYSGLFALLYGYVTGVNYLLRYGAADLLSVWLWSIFIGIVLFFLIAGVTAKRRRERVPTTDDNQLTILRKMSRNGLGMVVRGVQFKFSNIESRGFLIEKIEDEQPMVWVSPAINTNWGTSEAARNAQRAYQDNLDARADPAAIADQLDTAKQAGYVQIQWDTQGTTPPVPYPYHIKTEAITQLLDAGRIAN